MLFLPSTKASLCKHVTMHGEGMDKDGGRRFEGRRRWEAEDIKRGCFELKKGLIGGVDAPSLVKSSSKMNKSHEHISSQKQN